MENFKSILLSALLAGGLSQTAMAKGNSAWVDPYIGSDGHGHVFVGANVPFSAVQLGPNNICHGWDWTSGYHYSDNVIIGFSHNHLSGTGCADLGDVMLMPYSGTLRTLQDGNPQPERSASTRYSHDNEQVEPGYYRVLLDNGVNVELTTTERVGMHRYAFGGMGAPRVLIDLENGTGNRSYETYVRKVDDTTVEGYRFVKGWAPQHKVFFYAKFSQPIQSLATYTGDRPSGSDELQGRNVKAVATFGGDVRQLLVKVAISSVSCHNARMNMEAELPGWDFDATKQAAAGKWDEALSVVDIDATERQKRVFYTALYHTMIAPNLYCDVNGDFRGMDDRIYSGNKFQNYTTFSLWDTYRALHPLFTIIARDRVPDMVNSMLSIYDQNGRQLREYDGRPGGREGRY